MSGPRYFCPPRRPPGLSAGSVSIIRLSGTEAVPIALKAFRPGGRFRIGWSPASHRVYYGTAVDGDENVLDEVRAVGAGAANRSH